MTAALHPLRSRGAPGTPLPAEAWQEPSRLFATVLDATTVPTRGRLDALDAARPGEVLCLSALRDSTRGLGLTTLRLVVSGADGGPDSAAGYYGSTMPPHLVPIRTLLQTARIMSAATALLDDATAALRGVPVSQPLRLLTFRDIALACHADSDTWQVRPLISPTASAHDALAAQARARAAAPRLGALLAALDRQETCPS